ncbi:PTS sugar transporter subunit IIA [bacterium 1XD21-13]|nr:PTS sugar transporter subunit IIA [bacterium 1XD21-13]
MITEMLKPENVRIVTEACDWERAIEISTQALVDQGYITEQYPKTIIETTKKHGAYYVLCPDVALAHARPEDGVVKKQLALTLFRHPICFPNKKDTVRLIITLAAEDSNSHLDVLAQLAELLNDDSRIKLCVNMDSTEKLYEEFVRG